jgi:hypothetical protein
MIFHSNGLAFQPTTPATPTATGRNRGRTTANQNHPTLVRLPNQACWASVSHGHSRWGRVESHRHQHRISIVASPADDSSGPSSGCRAMAHLEPERTSLARWCPEEGPMRPGGMVRLPTLLFIIRNTCPRVPTRPASDRVSWSVDCLVNNPFRRDRSIPSTLAPHSWHLSCQM